MKKFESTKCSVEVLKQYFFELGGLHDAHLSDFLWFPDKDELQVLVDDINTNTLGLPSYPGLTPAALVFRGVSNFGHEAHLDTPETLWWIVDVMVKDSERAKGKWTIEFDFNSGEKMTWDFAAMEIRYVQGNR
jgi:hypothetical protein